MIKGSMKGKCAPFSVTVFLFVKVGEIFYCGKHGTIKQQVLHLHRCLFQWWSPLDIFARKTCRSCRYKNLHKHIWACRRIHASTNWRSPNSKNPTFSESLFFVCFYKKWLESRNCLFSTSYSLAFTCCIKNRNPKKTTIKKIVPTNELVVVCVNL